MPEPLIYKAAQWAAWYYPAPSLDGTIEQVQDYVDRITQSRWWHNHCPPSFLGEGRKGSIPRKVIVELDLDMEEGGTLLLDHLFQTGRYWAPKMLLGHGVVNQLPAIQDPWVVLHELAHVWAAQSPGHHGRDFCVGYHTLVHRYLGRDAGAMLKLSMNKIGVRVPYRLLAD